MTLNAQERAAVEAVLGAYFDHTQTAELLRVRFMQACANRTTSSDGDERLAFMALGHLSGFRAGVEAALKEVVLADSIEEARYEIRALLAQEDEHGS